MPAWSVPGTHSGDLAAHAVPAGEDVHLGLVQHVAHVQPAGDVGRRQQHGELLRCASCVSSGVAMSNRCSLDPVLGPALFNNGWIVCFRQFVAHGALRVAFMSDRRYAWRARALRKDSSKIMHPAYTSPRGSSCDRQLWQTSSRRCSVVCCLLHRPSRTASQRQRSRAVSAPISRSPRERSAGDIACAFCTVHVHGEVNGRCRRAVRDRSSVDPGHTISGDVAIAGRRSASGRRMPQSTAISRLLLETPNLGDGRSDSWRPGRYSEPLGPMASAAARSVPDPCRNHLVDRLSRSA